jgi:ABC-2 type transport system permease protein
MAGVNGSGLPETGDQGAEKMQGGAFGSLARAQYAALARMRFRVFTNGLRFRKGALELGARTFGYLLYGCTGLGLGAGVGVATYLLVSNHEWRFLPIVFWGAFFLWQMVPIMMASFQEQFDLGTLLRFPVSFESFFLLYTVFGLADISTILGGLCCTGIWIGMMVALPGMFLWTTLILAAFAVFNILLVRAVFAWIDRWLAQRRTREILTGAFLLLALSLQLLNPALHRTRNELNGKSDEQAEEYRRMQTRFEPWLRTGNAVQKWLPPGLAALALRQSAGRQPGPALGSLALLGLYALAAGAALAKRLKAEYRGENLGQAPGRSKTAAKRSKVVAAPAVTTRADHGWSEAVSGPVTAVIEKEARTLMRSIPQMYVLGAPLVVVFLFGNMFRSGGSGGHSFSLALPVCMAYSMLGFVQLFSNNLGTEGAGIQLIFLSPTPFRIVLLAKNLFHALLFCLNILLAGALVSLRLGTPETSVLVGTIGFLVFALPLNLAIGNLFSLTMPYRVYPGRLTRQRGSQANALLSLLTQLGVSSVGALVFGLCWYWDNLWIAAPVFVALSGVSVYFWMRVLRNADGMANRHKDSLIETLMKTQ